ncbi:DUF6630 family protein [Variovorax sp. LT1P1]|uniref:DUF6630 family protein n=1 Tax=Variovorax sp. LT1P1 TaxID=3443730 RepID=UPI003F46203C
MIKLLTGLFSGPSKRVPGPRASTLRNRAGAIASTSKSGPNAARELQRFMQIITSHLDMDEGLRLETAVTAAFHERPDASVAFAEGILGDDGQHSGHRLLIQVGRQAHDDLEGQVSEIAQSLGLSERWSWATPHGSRSVATGLREVGAWAADHGYAVLHLNLGDDASYAVMVTAPLGDRAQEAGAGAGLRIRSTKQYAQDVG